MTYTAADFARSKTPQEWAREITERHVPGGLVAIVEVESSYPIAIDDSGRCQGCQETGWRPDYIMPWPCAAWLLATAVLEAT